MPDRTFDPERLYPVSRPSAVDLRQRGIRMSARRGAFGRKVSEVVSDQGHGEIVEIGHVNRAELALAHRLSPAVEQLDEDSVCIYQ